ncbi:hypothetical protein FB451DRAFT_1145109 [Mycena latifolia]|nr:hypothetical protein FB451DRAFT_1145109 [Mycena latifolia]
MSVLRSVALRRVRQPLRSWDSACVHSRHYTVKAQDESAPRKGTDPQNIISTLTPSRITSSDYLDISHKTGLEVGFPTSRTGKLCYGYGHCVDLPFPDRTRGFLYYYSDPQGAFLEGSIRFRVTADNSPSSFAAGEDLAGPSGFTWQYSLAQVACRRRYWDIAKQLVHEELVTLKQLSRCLEVFGPRRKIFPQYTVFHLDSTFLVNFSHAVGLTIVADELHFLWLDDLFLARKIKKDKIVHYFPWAGSAIARFERSALPQHTGRPVLHLRILKIVTPVSTIVDHETYSGRPLRPEEGQLFMVRSRGGRLGPWAYNLNNWSRALPTDLHSSEPWVYDIDKPTSWMSKIDKKSRFKSAVALGVLWNNSRTQ